MKALKSPLLWYGGKTTVRKWIIGNFPDPLPRIYLEPFAGSLAVLLAKPKSFIEIVNDLDDRIINMWKVIRSRPQELAAQLWATPYSSANWRDGKTSEDEMEDARLLIGAGLQFYTGNFETATWAIDKSPTKHKPKPATWADYFLRVLPAAVRLKDVEILCEDAIKAIKRVADEPDCLIYVDPPYFGHENEYKCKIDYPLLVETLKASKCKVCVSEYASADDYWKDWRRVEKPVCGRAASGAHGVIRTKLEVLYMNY